MAGVFGKMPASGDFVARGLPRGAARALDCWLTLHVAEMAPATWPEAGLRVLMETAQGDLVALVLPSSDRSGRSFPLAAAERARGVGYAEAEAWAKAALGPLAEAAAGRLAPELLARRLAVLPPPPAVTTPLRPPLVWTAQGTPVSPSDGLRVVFGRLSSG